MQKNLLDVKRVVDRRLRLHRERLDLVKEYEPLDRNFIEGQISELQVIHDVLWAWLNELQTTATERKS